MRVQVLNGSNVVGGREDLVESDPLPPGYDTSWTNQWCCTVDDTVSTFDFNPRTVRVRADVGGQVDESNESNNDKLTPSFELKSL